MNLIPSPDPLPRRGREGVLPLPRRELGRAEHDLAFGIGNLTLTLAVGQHRETAPDSRPRRDLVIPALHRRILVEVDIAALGETRRWFNGGTEPREGDDVGHAVVIAGKPMRLFETMIQHA